MEKWSNYRKGCAHGAARPEVHTARAREERERERERERRDTRTDLFEGADGLPLVTIVPSARAVGMQCRALEVFPLLSKDDLCLRDHSRAEADDNRYALPLRLASSN